MNVLDRRLDLLRLEAKGFSKGDIVKIVAQDHNCTERTVWYDFAKRALWQPKLQALKEDQVVGKALNRYEHIYQQASLYHHYKRGKHPGSAEYFEEGEHMTVKDKLLALKIMLDTNTKYLEAALPDRASIKVEAAIRPFIIKKWIDEDAETTETR